MYAGFGTMPMRRLRDNMSDLYSVLKDFPDTKFVLMHINYPHEAELIAMTKYSRNVYTDMCWAWIINPLASVRFLKDFIVTAAGNKLLTFGGDFLPVELVTGHASMARRGITQALAELVEAGWLAESDLAELVPRIMNGNAHEIFDYERALKGW